MRKNKTTAGHCPKYRTGEGVTVRIRDRKYKDKREEVMRATTKEERVALATELIAYGKEG